ncbi:hypothetical protein LCGC14_2889640, partial [marine sediment metagenome]
IGVWPWDVFGNVIYFKKAKAFNLDLLSTA